MLTYSTTDGQTIAICETIKSVLIDNNLVDLIPISEFQKKELKIYDQVIVGASIRYGKHKQEVYDFIKTYQNDLKTKKITILKAMKKFGIILIMQLVKNGLVQLEKQSLNLKWLM